MQIASWNWERCTEKSKRPLRNDSAISIIGRLASPWIWRATFGFSKWKCDRSWRNVRGISRKGVDGAARRMEGMNPFWWSALLLSAWIGGVALVLSLLAGLLWLIRRSRGPLILFLALLIFTAMAGLTYVVSIMLMYSKWP